MKKQKIEIFLIFFLLFSIATSCKKDTPLPENPIINQLKKTIESAKVQRVVAANFESAFFELSINKNYGLTYSFENGFIIIHGQGWNLEKLVRYQVNVVDDQIVMTLLFSI
jgi:hypothetical protein